VLEWIAVSARVCWVWCVCRMVFFGVGGGFQIWGVAALSRVCAIRYVIKYVAVCCCVLQCVAVCCRVLQYVTVYCSVLQCVAVRCSVL